MVHIDEHFHDHSNAGGGVFSYLAIGLLAAVVGVAGVILTVGQIPS